MLINKTYPFDFYYKLIEKKIKIPYNLFLFPANEILNISKLSKIISAIANSGGGDVVIGIKKRNNIATEFNPIKNINFDEEFLYYEIQSYFSPQIINMEIKFHNITENETIIKITIPFYNNQLHLFADSRFYKWKNNKLQLMEEAEIRASYGQNQNAELEFLGITNCNGLPILNNGKINSISFYPKIFIKNIGNTIEKLYKIEFSFPSVLYDESFQAMNSAFARYEENNSVFTFTGTTPIFQNEITNPIEFKITVTNENFDTFLNANLTITLYYSNGKKEQKFKTYEIFTYNGEYLQKSDFISIIKTISI